MIQVQSDTELLEERLSRGAEMLFDMEKRGETGVDYERYLEHYTALLQQYEQALVRAA